MKITLQMKNENENIFFQLTKRYAFFLNNTTQKSILKQGNFRSVLKDCTKELNALKKQKILDKQNKIVVSGFLWRKTYNITSPELKVFIEKLNKDFLNEFKQIDKNVFKNV